MTVLRLTHLHCRRHWITAPPQPRPAPPRPAPFCPAPPRPTPPRLASPRPTLPLGSLGLSRIDPGPGHESWIFDVRAAPGARGKPCLQGSPGHRGRPDPEHRRLLAETSLCIYMYIEPGRFGCGYTARPAGGVEWTLVSYGDGVHVSSAFPGIGVTRHRGHDLYREGCVVRPPRNVSTVFSPGHYVYLYLQKAPPGVNSLSSL
jgi:hypothetical protein